MAVLRLLAPTRPTTGRTGSITLTSVVNFSIFLAWFEITQDKYKMTATFAREYRTWLMQWKQAAKARPSLFHFSEYSYAGKMSFTGLHKQAKRMLDKAYDDEIFPCILFS